MAERFVRPGAGRIEIEASAEQRTSPAREMRGAVIGGGASAPIPVQSRIDRSVAEFDPRTLNALQAMGDYIISEAVEQRQQEMYVEGARRTIEGEALADIVDEQPWYSKIFGPSATVQGARTLAQLQKVEEFSAQIHRDMHQLRTLSSDEFQQEVIGRIRSSTVGDSIADAAIQAQLLENLGPMVRAHTKEHLAYTQEQMHRSFTGALSAHAETMYAAAQGLVSGTTSEQDYGVLVNTTLSALQPLEGQTEDAYWGSIAAATEEAMARGNFHFVNVVEQTLYEHMPPEQRIKFQNDRRTYENRTMADLAAGQYSLEIAQLKARSAEGLISPAATWDNINRLNQKFRAQTGIDRDFMDHGVAEGIITNNLRGIITQQRAAAKEARDRQAKEQAHFQQVQAAQQAFLSGSLGSYIAQGGDRQTAQDTAYATVQAMREAGYAWGAVVTEQVNRDGFVIEPLRNQMQYGVRASLGEDYNAAFESSYQQWLELYEAPGGQSAALAYLGDDLGGAMERYHLERVASGDPAGSYRRNMASIPFKRGANPEVTKDLSQFLSNQVTNPGWWSRTFGNEVPLHPTSARTVAHTVAPFVTTANLPLGQEEQFHRGLAVARPTLDIVGPYAYNKGINQASVEDILGTDRVSAGKAFSQAIEDRLREVGISRPNNVEILINRQGPDSDPYWVIDVQDEGVLTPGIMIGEGDIREALENPRVMEYSDYIP